MSVARASFDRIKILHKAERVRLLAAVKERIPRALVHPTRVLERSAEFKRVRFFNYYFFKCILKNALTAKNGDVPPSTPRKVRPESLICTRDDEHP